MSATEPTWFDTYSTEDTSVTISIPLVKFLSLLGCEDPYDWICTNGSRGVTVKIERMTSAEKSLDKAHADAAAAKQRGIVTRAKDGLWKFVPDSERQN